MAARAAGTMPPAGRPGRCSRILFLIDELEVGGSQKQLLLLGRELRARGHDLALAYFRAEGAVLRRDLEAAGFRVRLVAKRRRVDARFLLDLARLLASERRSAVVAIGYTANLWARLAGTLVGSPRPVCLVGDRDYIPDLPGARLLAAAEWCLAWRSRSVVPNSPATARILAARRCVPRRKLRVVLNAVDTAAFRPRPDARSALAGILGSRLDGPVVGTLARLAPVKDLATLVRAARAVRDRLPGVRVVIGGEGPERGALESLRRELGVEKCVLLPGSLPAEQVVAAFDVAAMTSVSEGLPNFLVEAMALGVPAVSTAVGAISELLEEGRLGLLAPPGDPAAIARAILDVLDDPRAAATRAARAAEKVRGWTVGRMADEYLALLAPGRIA